MKTKCFHYCWPAEKSHSATHWSSCVCLLCILLVVSSVSKLGKLKDHVYKYSTPLNYLMCTLALSDQPKDWTVTSKRFISSFLRTSYSLAMAWLIASIFSWNKIEKKKIVVFKSAWPLFQQGRNCVYFYS